MHLMNKFFILVLIISLSFSLVSAIEFPKVKVQFSENDLQSASKGLQSGILESESFLYFLDNIKDDGFLKKDCEPISYDDSTKEYVLHCLEVPLYRHSGNVVYSYLSTKFLSEAVFSKESQVKLSHTTLITGKQITGKSVDNSCDCSSDSASGDEDCYGETQNGYGFLCEEDWDTSLETNPNDPRNQPAIEEQEREREREEQRIIEIKDKVAKLEEERKKEQTPEKIAEREAERQKKLDDIAKDAEEYRKQKATELAENDPDKIKRDAESENFKKEALERSAQREKEMEEYYSPENVQKRLAEREKRYEDYAMAAEEYRNQQREAELAQRDAETQNEINGGRDNPVETVENKNPYLELDGKKYYTEVKKGFWGNDKVVWKDPETGKELSRKEQNKATFVDPASTGDFVAKM